MRISCDYNNRNNITFGALKIIPSKKLSKEDISILLNNQELKNLVSIAEKKGIDIQAQYFCSSIKKHERGFICLKNSYDFTLGYYNLSSFEYDTFQAKPLMFQIDEKPRISTPKHKSIKEYAKITLDKLKSFL